MPLSEDRIHRGRPTPYPWERAALDQVYQALDDHNPHQAWELHELYDPSTGRLYELDLLVLSRQGLFLVEIKSHPGVLTGDMVDWTFTEPGGRRRGIECPYPGANHKARVLAGLLERHLGRERPYVQAAVFLPNVADVRLDGGRPPWLLTSKDVGPRLAGGLTGGHRYRVVNRPLMKRLLQVAHKVGLRPSTQARTVGSYRLGTLVDDGEGYQEHLAVHTSVDTDQARVRSYLVPAATSAERREQLQRAARREARILARLGQHPGILAYRAFFDDAPLGPAVVFEAFEGALPLHVFLRQHPDLTFDERLDILQQVVEAVAHCHRGEILHGNLSPASVLVRRDADGRLDARLHRFQVASRLEHSSFGTRHPDQLTQSVDRLYHAPEVLSDPDKASFESDVFSVGCLAWLLFTGQHPAATLAERDRRLRGSTDGEGGLRPSAVRADLAVLDEAVAFATHPNRHARADDLADWFDEYLLESITHPPAEPTAEVDPRQAQPGDALPGGLKVAHRLGKGSTALVLHVRREGRDLALKVPHDEGCGIRLQAEARLLRELRHPHVVALREEITISELPCLLLEFAGERTLADRLRAQGTLPLDDARRHGDELLGAVQYLEDLGLTHRDIKPGNIGFSSLSRKRPHLLLFDFSLSASDPADVKGGTAEWRDPWLYLRGAWDAAADRWSAAAVLYRALAGTVPQVAEESPDEVRIEPERLDAAVRDRLAAFFQRAFAREVEDRFASAEEMRRAWAQALTARAEEQPRAEHDVALDEARLETPVDALPLSARARNALDRAGVQVVGDLLQLPRNQLSVVRGVGTKVAREIVAVAEGLRSRLRVQAESPLLPGFVRPRLPLDDAELSLEASVRDRLTAAGLVSTVDLAQAQADRVRRLVGAEQADALRARLAELADAEPAPGSLADWTRALVGRASESQACRRLRVLVGLDPFPDGRPDSGLPAARSAPEVAASLGIEPAQVHSRLQFLRGERWPRSEITADLVQALSSLLDAHAPAVPLDDLARALAEERAGDEPTEADNRMAAALVRVALELRPDPPATWRRVLDRPWVARDPAVLDALTSLATTADRLAAQDALPSTETVREVLAAAVEGTPLAELPADRRLALAARASRTAAASARMELYPRGMAAARALTLSLGALTGTGLTPDLVRRRVAARYPDAAPLPDRPELDALLAPHGLVYVDGLGEYLRPGQHASTSSMTVQLPKRRPTVQPGFPHRRSPDAQRAATFQDQLDRSTRAGFRVVQVRADLAAPATRALSRALGVQPLSLDHLLVRALRAKAEELGVSWDNVESADRAGPEGPDWPLLLELVRRAAATVVEALPRRGGGGAERRRGEGPPSPREEPPPVLLTWPGALARYQLAGALARVAERAEREDLPAVLLVLPSHADGLAPSINGRLPVPAPLPGQRLLMPDAWLSRQVAEAS